MSQPIDRSYALGAGILVVLMLAGLVLLWREVLSKAARSRGASALLTPWPGSMSDLLLFFLLAVCGMVTLPAIGGIALRHSGFSSEAQLVLGVVLLPHVGLLAGVAVFYFCFARGWSRLAPAPWSSLQSGVVTVLIALPLVQVVAIAWQALLGACGLPVETPDNVQIFMDLHSPILRAVFAFMAIVVAPVNEEILFRAGLFRYFRGRFPRWIAVLLPALIFGAMHLTRAPLESLSELAPLVMLGVILSLAYERTGRIGTAIVAHALFNLVTVVLVLLGVNT